MKIIHPNGVIEWKEWYGENFNLNRNGAPALLWDDGQAVWFQQGMAHRENGPATIDPNGEYSSWVKGKDQSSPRGRIA